MATLKDRFDKKVAETQKQSRRIQIQKAINEGKEKFLELMENIKSKLEYSKSIMSAQIEDLKDTRSFQHTAKQEYAAYLKSFDESKIGTITKTVLVNGGTRVEIMTDMGPIIKTIEPSEHSNKPIEDKALDQDWYHARDGRKITYQGICSWIDDNQLEHFYYAKLTRMCTKKQASKHYNSNYIDNYYGLERRDNGTFKRVYATKNDITPMPIYDDLCRAFNNAYRNYSMSQDSHLMENN